MEKLVCHSCDKNKTELLCGHCHMATCKTCATFVDEDSFDFFNFIPEALQNKAFCHSCNLSYASKEIDRLQETLKKAKQVNIYRKEQGTETRFIRRMQKPITVSDCQDENETLLRLAFMAVQIGFSTLVDVQINSKKIGEGRYKKYVFDGFAVPVDSKIHKSF